MQMIQPQFTQQAIQKYLQRETELHLLECAMKGIDDGIKVCDDFSVIFDEHAHKTYMRHAEKAVNTMFMRYCPQR